MQEQNEQKEAKLHGRMGKKDIIWLGVCIVIIGILLIGGLYIHRKIPMTSHGESNTPFPWRDSGMVVEKVEAQWQNSAKSGSPYMESHVGYYPYVTIRLAEECKGSGTLAIRVTDGDDNVRNKLVRVFYRDGEFVRLTRNNPNDLEEASGKEAKLHIPCGMGKDSKDGKDFMYHAATRDRQLWRIYVSNRPDGEVDYTDLGYTTIPVTGKEI